MYALPGNAVNSDDFLALFRQMRRRPAWLASKLLPGAERRIRAAWAHTAGPPIHFWDVPEVVARTAELATGNRAVTIPSYLADAYLDGDEFRGISLGCGTGQTEMLWAQTGRFAKLRCFDLSAERIAFARRMHSHPALCFEAMGAYELSFAPGTLDVVIFKDSLHHLAPVRTIVERCASWLRPEGRLFVTEYVGPRRLQVTRRQTEAANAILAMLPEGLRVSYAHGTVKRKIGQPSRLRMRLLDPSEAVESDLILPSISGCFDILEQRNLGGTLVNPVLDDIAHHFVHGETAWLETMFSVEDGLIASGEISSDYTLLVARPK